jgi:hypothetical protein
VIGTQNDPDRNETFEVDYSLDRFDRVANVLRREPTIVTELDTILYNSLRLYPCRCRMKGGEKWHLRAQTEVEMQCSRCIALEEYDKKYGPQENGQS